MRDDMYVRWGDHHWLDKPRHFHLESGQSIFQRRCVQCGRDFVIDESSGARHAVRVSIFSFHRLTDEVTQRWVGEACPGKRLPSNDVDREKEIAELRIQWDRSRGIRRAAHSPESPGATEKNGREERSTR
jgi:hypothetical protein